MNVMADRGFRFIDTRHEQAAVHMADAFGRITGRPGVCMYTTPGLVHALPGLVHALHTESPVISISGCTDQANLGRSAHQEIDQIGMATAVTKGAFMVPDAYRIPYFIARAVRLAFSGRRGPVHLTIPIDVQEQLVDDDLVPISSPAGYRPASPVTASTELTRQIIGLLRQAERPLVIAGDAAGYSPSGEALQRFVETTRLPILTEDQARGMISDDHPYCFGWFRPGMNRVAPKIRDADLVMLLGRKQDHGIGFCLPPMVAANAKIIQVDPLPLEIGRNRGVAVGIVGDIDKVLEQLTAEAAGLFWKELPWLGELRAIHKAQQEWVDSLATPECPMHPFFVGRTLEKMLWPDDCLVVDGGDFGQFARSVLPARMPKRSFGIPLSLGLLGAAIPTAVAAKLAYQQSRVIVLLGDGSFGFNGMEFDTAVRHRLNIVAILGNDSGWGTDRQLQVGFYGRAVATELPQTHYEQVVQSLGGYGEFVERPEDLEPAIQRSFNSGLPSLLNVVIQRAMTPVVAASIARHKAAHKVD